MKKINEIVNLILLIINGYLSYNLSHKTFVNMMPGVEHNFSFIEKLKIFYIGKNFEVIIFTIVSLVISFIIGKILLRSKVKYSYYFLYLILLLIVNTIFYRMGVRIVV